MISMDDELPRPTDDIASDEGNAISALQTVDTASDIGLRGPSVTEQDVDAEDFACFKVAEM